MRSRMSIYLVATILVAAVVGLSIILPGKLLQRQEESLIGKVTSVKEAPLSINLATHKNVKKDSTEELHRKISLLTSKYIKEEKSREPNRDEMSMRQAILKSERQLVQLASLGVLPQEVLEYINSSLIAFPTTIQDLQDGFELSIWNIHYVVANPKGLDSYGELSLILDAETGKVYSIQWVSKNRQYNSNAREAGIAFAEYLDVPVKPEMRVLDNGLSFLISKDNRFSIRIESSGEASLGMSISIQSLGDKARLGQGS